MYLLESMGKEETFENFLVNSKIEMDIGNFITNILLTFVVSLLIGYIYKKYGRSLSNRNSFAENFPILSMTTMLIISIVKSSLALSLGLVGALSIVRFRTALKEPEELTFAFLSIAIGLGLGANQRLITIIGFLIISTFYILRRKLSSSIKSEVLNLIISCTKEELIDQRRIIEIIEQYTNEINLKRFTENESKFELGLSIKLRNYQSIIEIKNKLTTIYPKLSLNFIDNSTIFGS